MKKLISYLTILSCCSSLVAQQLALTEQKTLSKNQKSLLLKMNESDRQDHHKTAAIIANEETNITIGEGELVKFYSEKFFITTGGTCHHDGCILTVRKYLTQTGQRTPYKEIPREGRYAFFFFESGTMVTTCDYRISFYNENLEIVNTYDPFGLAEFRSVAKSFRADKLLTYSAAQDPQYAPKIGLFDEGGNQLLDVTANDLKNKDTGKILLLKDGFLLNIYDQTQAKHTVINYDLNGVVQWSTPIHEPVSRWIELENNYLVIATREQLLHINLETGIIESKKFIAQINEQITGKWMYVLFDMTPIGPNTYGVIIARYEKGKRGSNSTLSVIDPANNSILKQEHLNTSESRFQLFTTKEGQLLYVFNNEKRLTYEVH